MDPLVSVIMPIYNGERHLRQSLESVLGQTYRNIELLAVDNNSSDRSLEVVEEYARKDSRVRLLRCTRQGPAFARNMGIREASGRFIAFLDCDDLWALSKLEEQLSFMCEHGHALTHTNYERISEEGEFICEVKCRRSELTYEQLLRSNSIGCLTAIYDAEMLGKRYMPLIQARQDYGLWLAILKDDCNAHCLPTNLAKYRVRSGKSVSSDKLRLVRYNWKLFRQVEQLSMVRSVYFLMWNIYRKLIQ
jgi:teichuronic acid biosynthesis glycosyltransferase TuaG